MVARRGFARLGRLVILECDGGAVRLCDRVRGSGEKTGVAEIGLLFGFLWLFACGYGEGGLLGGQRGATTKGAAAFCRSTAFVGRIVVAMLLPPRSLAIIIP